jgi:hypothetical protein
MPHGAAFSGLLTTYLFRIVIKIGEKFRLKVQFRAEAFNLLNRPNYAANLVTLFTSQGAPVPSSAALKTTRTKSRQIQFGLRLEF